MNGPCYNYTHGFDSSTGKPTAVLRVGNALYAHFSAGNPGPTGYMRYCIDTGTTGNGALGTFDVPYTAFGTWTIAVQFDYDRRPANTADATHGRATAVVFTITSAGTPTTYTLLDKANYCTPDFMVSQLVVIHSAASTVTWDGLTKWPARVVTSSTSTSKSATAYHAPPTGGSLFHGAHGEQWVARMCIDDALTGAYQQRQRIYFRGSEDDPWAVSKDISINYDWDTEVPVHGYMASGPHDGREVSPVRKLVKRYVVASSYLPTSMDLGDTWTAWGLDGLNIPHRATAWHPALNGSMIAIYRPDVAGGDNVTAFCMPRESPGLDSVIDYLRNAVYAPLSLPSTTTFEVRDVADYTGPRPYPVIWPSGDDANATLGCVTAGLYREWTVPSVVVVGTGITPELTHSESCDADLECANFAVWSAEDGTQMLTGWHCGDEKVRTWYRVGRSGSWGSVRAEWSVPMATAPYCHRRNDGAWEVGWLVGSTWTQYRTGNPASDASGWEAV